MGLRVAGLLPAGVKRLALTSSPACVPELRAHGLTPLLGNLDDVASLRRLAGLATRVVHLAPPPSGHPQWREDPRTQTLLQVLRLRGSAGLPRSVV